MLSLNHIPAPMTSILAANWLNISINLLLVIHVVICLLLALVVLMQRPKQEGLGAAFGGGLTDQAFGARTTDVLQKSTVYLGTLFFVITLVLAILIGKRQSDNPTLAIVEEEKVEQAVVTPEEPEDPSEVKAAVQMPKLPTQEPKPEGEANAPEGEVNTPPSPEAAAEKVQPAAELDEAAAVKEAAAVIPASVESAEAPAVPAKKPEPAVKE